MKQLFVEKDVVERYAKASNKKESQIEFEEELSDDENPIYLYSTINTSLLVKIVNGEIDPTQLARTELNNRGLDNDGQWVGFNREER